VQSSALTTGAASSVIGRSSFQLSIGYLEMQENRIMLQSDAGKQALAHAMNNAYTVLEFKERDGELTIMDITEHYRQMEQIVNDEDPAPATQNEDS